MPIATTYQEHNSCKIKIFHEIIKQNNDFFSILLENSISYIINDYILPESASIT